MKEGWEVKKFTDVCHIQYGYAFDSSCFCDDDNYPQLIRIRDVVRGYSETFYNGNIPEGYFVYKGDYLIGMDGEFHIAPWQSEKALLNQRVCKISASDCDVDERFIYYTMSVVLKQIEDETPFVTVKHLSAKRLNLVKIPIPPLPEQSRIVKELDQLSNIIEKKRQQLSELDNLAQSIFNDMFGDPVTNEKGWEIKKLTDVCYIQYGYAFDSSCFCDDESYPQLVRIRDIIRGFSETFYKGDIPEGYYIYKGDYLIGMDGEFNIAPWQSEKALLNQRVCKISSIGNIVDYFVYYYMRNILKEIEKETSFVTVKHLSAKRLNSISIPFPPLNLQQLFAQKIEAIEKEKELIKQSIKETEELFNSRMDYYFG